jgi:hypothetical protein
MRLLDRVKHIKTELCQVHKLTGSAAPPHHQRILISRPGQYTTSHLPVTVRMNEDDVQHKKSVSDGLLWTFGQDLNGRNWIDGSKVWRDRQEWASESASRLPDRVQHVQASVPEETRATTGC